MIELVFVACLSASPAECESRTMRFVEVSVMACAMGAQAVLAQWVAEHPGREIRRWTCQPAAPGRNT